MMLSTQLKSKLSELEEAKKVINRGIQEIKNQFKKPWKCDKCGKVSKSLIYHEKHVLSCQGAKDICPICRIDISDDDNHICQCQNWKLDKNDSRGYSRCTKIFVSSWDKRTHMKKCSGCKSEALAKEGLEAMVKYKQKKCIPVPNIKMEIKNKTPSPSPEPTPEPITEPEEEYIYYKLQKKHLEPLGIYNPNSEWRKLTEILKDQDDPSLYFIYCANSLFLEDRPFEYVELEDLEDPVFILSDNKETFDLVE